jgi:SnoaL-like domain
MEVMAARIRTSFNARDIDTFRSLIAESATWGSDPDAPQTCRSRNDIVATYKRLLAEGVSGRVVETTAGPGGVAALLEVEWPDPGHEGRGPTFYHVFLVADGLITKIEGHDDRDLALASIST